MTATEPRRAYSTGQGYSGPSQLHSPRAPEPSPDSDIFKPRPGQIRPHNRAQALVQSLSLAPLAAVPHALRAMRPASCNRYYVKLRGARGQYRGPLALNHCGSTNTVSSQPAVFFARFREHFCSSSRSGCFTGGATA